MRRPGPRGQKRSESFGSSSVQALLEVTSVVRGERDLKSALATIVKTVAEELEVLCALAAHAAIAIETAQQSARTARHRASLEQLLEVSSTLTAAQSTQSILETVCRGIHTALGFQKVSIELVDLETGLLRSRASSGWEVDDPAVLRAVPFDPMRALFDPDFEVSGCYLVPNDEARARIDADHIKYSSQSNGRGPHARNHHWLLVALCERNGEEMGFIWADDPED